MNVIDIGMISIKLIQYEEIGVPFFAIYLWVTLGSGFRFGGTALILSAIMSLLGLSMVVVTADYWRTHVPIAIGVYICLLVIPGYVLFLLRRIDLARKRAIEANAAKGEFLARMSHELRTPLNGITMSADLLGVARTLSADERSLLTIIHDAVAVSLRHIDNLLSYSKIEAGRLTLDHIEFDLHDTVRTTLRLVRPVARNKNLLLLSSVSPDTPCWLVGDPHRLREVLINLVSNAVKFTDTGYAALCVSTVGCDHELVRLRFEVVDTGVGIASESLERIWEGFAQEDTSTSRRFGGTGLGTAIAKQLVELMGGEIGVSSVKGSGTAFWFEIPFNIMQNKISPNDSVLRKGISVMLFTADAATERYVRGLVAGMEGRCDVAATVQDGVSVMARAHRMGLTWHLALVDDAFNISDNGAPYIGEIIANSVMEQVPVYLLSDDIHDARRLYQRGYSGALPRGISAEALANIIRASANYSATPQMTEQNLVKVEPWIWGRSERAWHRVLMIDNNRTDRLIIHRILVAAGYKVDVAESGEDALNKLEAGGYSVAVLDLHMPGVSGIAIIQQYRFITAGQGSKRIPIVILSADSSFVAESDSASAGADAFLTKPVSAEQLINTLVNLIQDWELSNPKQSHQEVFEVSPEKIEVEKVLDLPILERLKTICRGTNDFSEIVTSFIEEGGAILDSAFSAFRSCNDATYREHMHALRGMAANVGAVRLAAACRRDCAGDALESDRDEQWLQQVRAEYNITCEYLRVYMS